MGGKVMNISELLSNPRRSIIGLSIPMVVTLLISMVNNVADAMWVSGLGADALAAIGFVTPLFIIIIALGTGISAGVNSSVARFIGAGKFEDAGNSSVHGIILSIVISIILPVVVILFLKPIIVLMGGASVIDLAYSYGFWIMVGSFTLIVSNIFSGIYRSENMGTKATVPLAISAALNIIMDPIFIYTFNLGVGGAAIATVLANLIGLLIFIYWTYAKNVNHLNMRTYKRSKLIYKDIISVGFPASMEQILMSVFAMIVNIILVMVAGTVSVAIFTTVWRLVNIGIMVPVGIGTGSISVFGALYGAKKFDTIKDTFKFTHIIGFIGCLIMGVILAIFSKQLAILFGGAGLNAEISNMTILLSWVVVFSSLSIISGSVLQSFGKGNLSLYFTFFRMIILTLVFMFLLISLKALGVYYGIILAFLVGGVIEIIFVYKYVNSLGKYLN